MAAETENKPGTPGDPQPPATQERGELLTAQDGLLRTPPALREKIAIFKSGLCLVARTHAEDHDVISAIALARRLGHHIYPPQYVDLGAIRAVYAEAAEAAKPKEAAGASDTEMKKEVLDILRQASEAGTSDVHLVVERGQTMVWFRRDGERTPIIAHPWPASHGHQICRAAYAMADVADASYEQFAYQAARISTGLPEGIQAIRLQFNPVGTDGRQLVMRLLYNKQSAGDNFEDLGFFPEQIEELALLRSFAVGIVCISGPTGSGKSTTLERMMRALVKENPGDHILTVEDPPEYVIPGVVQLPVSNAHTDEQRAVAYAEAIAAAMRSDPDRMMIGEVRTKASADLAYRSALTGHAVYTTVHANDAISIIPRFLDIGIEPYLLRDPGIVRGLTAQRLIRKICPACRKKVAAGSDLPGDLAARLKKRLPDAEIYTAGPGCDKCREGFKGRTVCAEIIMPDDKILELLTTGRKMDALRYWLDELHGKDMMHYALKLIAAGLVDPVEIDRKIGRIE
ncbi:MAG: hypothetical protein A2018_06600 [Alphaproteobacteria bacterium GWF2_58_20]|nr:MAG: hypothetical protein A2018_06600 [Alphaproteobacteria bacterium GWF2_58_20]